MGRGLAIILLLTGFSLSAQEKMTFLQVDSTTYQQYLQQDWKSLIRTGKTALDQDINYYYLQARIAYAHFAREEYRKAIPYYKNALEFNSKDPIANEYLYYCYQFSGRENDAWFQRSSLSAEQREAMNVSDTGLIRSLGIQYSYLTSNAHNVQDAIVNDLTRFDNGVQKTLNSFHYAKLYIRHHMGERILVNHRIGYLSKNEFSYAINSGFFLSPEQILPQTDYSIRMEIRPAEGWLISPGFHYMKLRVPLFDLNSYGMMAGKDRLVYSYLEIVNKVFSFELQKDVRYFSIAASYAFNDFNYINGHQAGLHLDLYPLGNLKLYYSTDAYYQLLAFNGELQKNYILNQTLGFKIHNNLWMELSAGLPEQMNLYEIRNNIAYNNIEKIKAQYNATLIVPLFKPGLKIITSVGYQENSSYFFPDTDMLNPYNNHLYRSLTISGGITWTR